MQAFSITLLILKIILIIIAIILVLLLLLIFIPFRYTIDATYDEKELNVKANYLFIPFLINAKFTNGFKLNVWIFKKQIVNSEQTDKKEKGDSIGATKFIKDKNVENEITESKTEIKKLFIRAKKYEEEFKNDEHKYAYEDKEDKKKKVDYTISRFNGLLPKDFIYILKKFLYEVSFLLKELKPRKVDVSLEFGNGDPADVGMLLAIASPLYALVGDKVRLKPSFESEVLTGNIYIYGRPKILFMLIPLVKVLLDKKCRQIILGKKIYKKK